ncbi:polysaccharide pyruvyl transferase family protein [Salmonella enterica]|uniref:polysaccharide pyruvyl transferase family protein n=1 Tax=Salmonella enterica TaxID=28901 RepID=UPI002AFE4145|nr:polysaccharide pyruvyl transferase family protein [Salmonella enterica]
MKIENLALRLGLTKFYNLPKLENNNLICIYDTSVSSLNVGDEIINQSGTDEIKTIFPHEQFFRLSTHVGTSAIGISYANLCRHRIVCGSNLLSDKMYRSANWYLSPLDIIRMKSVILLGVGWNKYSDESSYYTKLSYKYLFDKHYLHSVRDNYTKKKMELLGFHNTINTGCPTMWRLTESFCKNIRTEKSESVVFTLTDYDKDHNNDYKLISILKKEYKNVYFWPQGSGDLEYFLSMKINNVTIIPPRLSDYDHILKSNIDFIGTRLHGGIRALQHKNKAIIIGIDNRAIEKNRDFNLPVIIRENIESELKEKIYGKNKIDIRIDEESINKWKEQFKK